MAIATCPVCSARIGPTDRSCEACGSAIGAPAIITGIPGGACPTCQAPASAIDADGFCGVCGMQRQEREHIEIVLSPTLAGVTDRGLRHGRNEDDLAARDLPAQGSRVLVVCDGVSQSQAPDQASRAAATAACAALAAALESGEAGDAREAPLQAAMRAAVTRAQEAARAVPYSVYALEDAPATTLVAAIVQGRRATIGWVGDSRAYWVPAPADVPANAPADVPASAPAAGVRLLTHDHSWAAEVVEAGLMSDEQAARAPQAHAITRWLGVDVADDPRAVVTTFEAPGAGAFLLCTDGLWGYLETPERLATLTRGVWTDASAMAAALVTFALRCGGRGNVTALVAIHE